MIEIVFQDECDKYQKGSWLRSPHFFEWYGWNGRDNEGLKLDGHSIGKGIKDREVDMGIHSGVRPGPADSSIFDPTNEKSSVATVPVLSRSTKVPDDVDTNLEDHIGDELRYRLRRKMNSMSVMSV